MITLISATADRDDYHSAGMAAVAAADWDGAACLFWLASQHAPLTSRQQQEQMAVHFASLPRAGQGRVVLTPETREQDPADRQDRRR